MLAISPGRNEPGALKAADERLRSKIAQDTLIFTTTRSIVLRRAPLASTRSKASTSGNSGISRSVYSTNEIGHYHLVARNRILRARFDKMQARRAVQRTRAISLVAAGGDGQDLHVSTAQSRRDHQSCRLRLLHPDP